MKKIDKKKQMILILIPLVVLLVLRLILNPHFEVYTKNTSNLVILVGALLLLITYFSKDKLLKVIDYVKIIFITLASFVIIQTYFVAPFNTDGLSMYETINDGDILLARVTNNYEFGDVSIVNFKEDDILICKRIIGLPGDNIYYDKNKLYRNGSEVKEEYLSPGTYTYDFDLSDVNYSGELALDVTNGIPEGYYLVLGDNREVSLDSRQIGLIREEDLYAKVFFDVNKFERVK